MTINLTEKTKRLLFIAFFILFSIGSGYALYYFFFKPMAPSAPGLGSEQGYEGGLGQAGPRKDGAVVDIQGQIGLPVTGDAPGTGAPSGTVTQTEVTVLRDSVTQALSPTADGQLRYYSPEDGRFYKMKEDGTLALLSDRQFFNVDKVNWANSADKVILEFPDGNNIYYDFQDQRQVSLPTHWSEFTFAPKDDQIVAKSIGLDQGNRFLITSQPDGNEATAVYHMGQNADLVIPSWSPNNQVIAFSRTGVPQSDNAEQIYLLGKNHENFNALNVPGRGFIPSWSPTGKKLLYSVYHERDNARPMLWITDAAGQEIGRNRRKLNLMTWADKCVWGNDSELFCGVPIELPVGAGYSKQTFAQLSDDIYYINLETGVSKKINTPDQNRPVSKPVLSQDRRSLFFTDAYTGKLYTYSLKY